MATFGRAFSKANWRDMCWVVVGLVVLPWYLYAIVFFALS